MHKILLVLAQFALLTARQTLAQTPDEDYPPVGSWNNVRVYLSPARHSDTGKRGECDGASENILAYNVAKATAVILASRGYHVRIGRGTFTSAWQRSNAWGADLHIVLHSNARGEGGGCDANPVNFGTMVLFKKTSPESLELATELKTHLGPLSPGVHDFICPHPGDPCTRINQLAEIMHTNAVVVYSETEFHDWSRGVSWLKANSPWALQLAAAIDEYLHYPRAPSKL